MNTLKKTAVVLLVSAVVWSFSGCDEYATKKQEMVAGWEQSTATAKIPMVEDLIERGEIEEAKKTLEKCLQSDPQSAQLYLLAGRIHFIEGRTEEARSYFEKAVELDSELAEGWHQLGSLAAMEKDYTLALQHYSKTLELQPLRAEYRASVADVLIELGQAEQAKETLQAGLRQQPRNLELKLALARLHHQLGDIQQAIQTYEQAQLMHGNHPRVLEPCGYAYVALKKWDKAAEKFTVLLEKCQPETVHYNVVLRSLAMCSFNSGDYSKALNCYDELSVVNREDPEIWVGMAQSALGLDDTKRAIFCADKALRLKPAWPEAYAVLASAQYMQGQYEKSLDTFHVIIHDDELSGFAWFMIGRCYRQMGQTAEAQSAFDRAEQLDPDSDLVTAFLKKTVQSL